MKVLLLVLAAAQLALAKFVPCGRVTDTKGELTSHAGFGSENLPPNVDCAWTIRAPKGMDITLRTKEFDMLCREGGLRVIALHSDIGWGQWEKYCGRIGPNKVYKKATSIYLQIWGTDNPAPQKGFKISWETTPSSGQTTIRPTPPPTTTQPPITVPPPSGSCGVPARTPLEGNSRIVGGQEVKPHSWPWMAKMYGVGCGATLLAPQWVVSAAHCFRSTDASRYSVGLGLHDRQDGLYRQIIRVAKVIKHERYNIPKTMDNDITLLKLEKPAVINDYVSPVCLPKTDVPDGKMCYVTGWGNTEGTSNHGNLKQAAVPIVNRNACSRMNYNKVTDTMICAGYQDGGHDSCQGDSGGPFVCKTDAGNWELQGVVSWGYGCADAGKPGVYSRVVSNLDWIREKMANN